LRFFNVAGATAATGWDVNSHNLIPAVLRSLKSGEVFQVFGNDYSTQDGTGVRDYLHVSDLGRAIFHFVTQSESFSEIPLIYNLGTGKGTSVFEVIKCAEVVSGISADISILPRRKGDAAEIFASTEKFYELTGWKMEQSVKSMIQSSWNVMAGD
jgi:UDP-glucose 4-epimerase